MTWEITRDEARQLLALPTGDRAIPFFQLLADWEGGSGVRDADDGWVVASATDALPLWPHAARPRAASPAPWGPGKGPYRSRSRSTRCSTSSSSCCAEEERPSVAVCPSPDDPGLLLSPRRGPEYKEREMEIGR